jgi:hypothetical protein
MHKSEYKTRSSVFATYSANKLLHIQQTSYWNTNALTLSKRSQSARKTQQVLQKGSQTARNIQQMLQKGSLTGNIQQV